MKSYGRWQFLRVEPHIRMRHFNISCRGLFGRDAIWCCGRITMYRRTLLRPSLQGLRNASILSRHLTALQRIKTPT